MLRHSFQGVGFNGHKPGRAFIALVVMTLLGVASLHATPWNNGTVDSTVNIPSDYATLGACGAAFTGVAGGINANWTISITTGTYTEPATAFFANTIAAGKTVTLKPAPGATVAFNFTQTVGNTNIQGGLVIGARSDVLDDVAATNGFIIDGSNNGTTTRDMTLTNTLQSAFAANVIRVWGASLNGIIKNVVVTSNCNIAGANQGIALTSRHTATPADLFPSGWTIQNCIIDCHLGAGSNAIACDTNGTMTAGITPVNNTTIVGNTLTGAQRCISLRLNANTTITDNIFKVLQTVPATNSFGISHLSVNSTNGVLITIARNNFNQLNNVVCVTGGSGITAMDLSSGNFATNYLIYDNMICGYSLQTGAAADLLYRGIYTGSSILAAGSFKVYNNSIYMPSFAGINCNTLVNVAAIAMNNGTSATLDVRNNLIYMAQGGPTNGGIAIAKATAAGPFTACDYNAFTILGTNSFFGRQNGTNYPSLSTWQASANTPDLNGQVFDPTASAGSAWASATDLHFVPVTAAPGGLNPGTTVSLVTTDIDGLTRDTTNPMRGADELGPVILYVNAPNHNQVEVTFFATAGAMGAGVTTPSNYTISGSGQGTLASNPDSVALVSGRTYRLTWNTGGSVTGGTITITGSANIKDAVGNALGSPNSQSQSNVLSAASDWNMYQ